MQKQHFVSRLLLHVLFASGFAPAAMAGDELCNPFTCVHAGEEEAKGGPSIVLIGARLYEDARLIEQRLRAVAGAAAGSPDDVHVVLAGLVQGDLRSLAYKEDRLGLSLNGRISGLEDELSYAVAGLSTALFALVQNMTSMGELADMRKRIVPMSAIRLHVLREIYLLPLAANAWCAVDRPIAAHRGAEIQHIEEIVRVFDLVVDAARNPASEVPAPDHPEFERRILRPHDAALEDDWSFLCVLRALVLELIEEGESAPLHSRDVAPGYRPDWDAARELVKNDLFIGASRNAVMNDIVLRWRHFDALRNIAAEYCKCAPGEQIEVIVAICDRPGIHALLQQSLGSNFPIAVKDITDPR